MSDFQGVTNYLECHKPFRRELPKQNFDVYWIQTVRQARYIFENKSKLSS